MAVAELKKKYKTMKVRTVVLAFCRLVLENDHIAKSP